MMLNRLETCNHRKDTCILTRPIGGCCALQIFARDAPCMLRDYNQQRYLKCLISLPSKLPQPLRLILSLFLPLRYTNIDALGIVLIFPMQYP